jgi:hypothetical protein
MTLKGLGNVPSVAGYENRIFRFIRLQNRAKSRKVSAMEAVCRAGTDLHIPGI